ncbi:restriction endonuclease subunit S [Anoxybacillus sp.]|uniref:restriction endonuclease subunit S n=1 Tax=Anoxybacillus sp. TaxID=1872573 RepID=UPI002625257C|nr:restriction endonuclease subunit S [uncultured Anoxybacillus sp.]
MNFRTYKLKDIGEVITGNTPSKSNSEFYDSKDVMFIKPDDLYIDRITMLNESKEYLSNKGAEHARILPQGSVLVTCIGIIGKIGILKQEMAAFNQQINAIVPNKNIVNEKYLAYKIWNDRKKLQRIANAPVVPIINKRQFSDFQIEIPPIDYQLKVVDVLDKAQELIDKRKAQIEALDQLMQSVFLEMFGDLKGRQVSLSELCYINPSKKEIENMDKNLPVTFLPMANVSENGELNLSESRLIKEVFDSFTYFREGDVLFAKITPCMENGKGAIARKLINNIGFGSTEFHVLRPKENVNSTWLYYLTSLQSFRKQAEMNMTGSAGQKRVPKQFFSKYKVVLPPIERQNQFAEIVQKIQVQKEVMKKSLTELENNFNSLMQRAFRGELFND